MAHAAMRVSGPASTAEPPRSPAPARQADAAESEMPSPLSTAKVAEPVTTAEDAEMKSPPTTTKQEVETPGKPVGEAQQSSEGATQQAPPAAPDAEAESSPEIKPELLTENQKERIARAKADATERKESKRWKAATEAQEQEFFRAAAMEEPAPRVPASAAESNGTTTLPPDQIGDPIFDFGHKHRGRTFAEVASMDPTYLDWALKKHITDKTMSIGLQRFIAYAKHCTERDALIAEVATARAFAAVRGRTEPEKRNGAQVPVEVAAVSQKRTRSTGPMPGRCGRAGFPAGPTQAGGLHPHRGDDGSTTPGIRTPRSVPRAASPTAAGR